jgi:hypothetical protein
MDSQPVHLSTSFHLCGGLQVLGPSRGVVTDSDRPVALVLLTQAIFLAGPIWSKYD